MSKPLTPDDLRILREIDNETGHPDCIEAALARLDYLERKVQAASKLADAAHHMSHQAILAAACDYDEVQP